MPKAQMVRWGNSLAVRIPKAVAEQASLREGDSLLLEVEAKGAVVLKAVKRPVSLKDLVSQITPENIHGEQDWGPAGGGELW